MRLVILSAILLAPLPLPPAEQLSVAGHARRFALRMMAVTATLWIAFLLINATPIRNLGHKYGAKQYLVGATDNLHVPQLDWSDRNETAIASTLTIGICGGIIGAGVGVWRRRRYKGE